MASTRHRPNQAPRLEPNRTATWGLRPRQRVFQPSGLRITSDSDQLLPASRSQLASSESLPQAIVKRLSSIALAVLFLLALNKPQGLYPVTGHPAFVSWMSKPWISRFATIWGKRDHRWQSAHRVEPIWAYFDQRYARTWRCVEPKF
jgi:hypothetical protein